jgi:polyhydroxyalkanoate synthesis regulator phasin
MKEEDIKALVNAVKKEFQQEITTLNERIQHLEQQNLNLNTFIQHHFERLDRKTDENHQYILNTWNPFMKSTIEGVKNDLIQAMDSNKKDDNELSKRVDTLAIQVTDLNKMVVDEDPLLGYVLVGIDAHKCDLFSNKNEEYDNVGQILSRFKYQIGGYGSCVIQPIIFYLESLSRFKKVKRLILQYFERCNVCIKYNNKNLYEVAHGLMRNETKKIIEDYCKTIGVECVYEYN